MRGFAKKVLLISTWIIFIGGTVLAMILSYNIGRGGELISFISGGRYGNSAAYAILTFLIYMTIVFVSASIPLGLYAVLDGQDKLNDRITVLQQSSQKPQNRSGNGASTPLGTGRNLMQAPPAQKLQQNAVANQYGRNNAMGGQYGQSSVAGNQYGQNGTAGNQYGKNNATGNQWMNPQSSEPQVFQGEVEQYMPRYAQLPASNPGEYQYPTVAGGTVPLNPQSSQAGAQAQQYAQSSQPGAQQYAQSSQPGAQAQQYAQSSQANVQQQYGATGNLVMYDGGMTRDLQEELDRPETSVLTSDLKNGFREDVTLGNWKDPIPHETFSLDQEEQIPLPENVTAPAFLNSEETIVGDYSEDKTVLIMPKNDNSERGNAEKGNAEKIITEKDATLSKTEEKGAAEKVKDILPDADTVMTDADSAAEVMSPPTRTWECPLCKAHIPATETKCFCCGYDSKLGTDAEKECKYCHKKIKADATYCIHCGAYV